MFEVESEYVPVALRVSVANGVELCVSVPEFKYELVSDPELTTLPEPLQAPQPDELQEDVAV